MNRNSRKRAFRGNGGDREEEQQLTGEERDMTIEIYDMHEELAELGKRMQ